MNSANQGSLSVVVQVIEILERLAIRYHLGGSFASAVHGMPRQTLGADLVVDLAISSAVALVNQLSDGFYVDADVATEAVTRRGSFNAIHLNSGFKVDFFVKGNGDFDAVELERSELVQIAMDPPRSAYVKSAEDTVLRKLQWYREGGEVSDRQWRDVLGVLATVGSDMNLDYLRHWARSLDVADLLDRALKLVEPG